MSAVLSGVRLSVQTERAEDSALSSAGMLSLHVNLVSFRSGPPSAGVAELADALDSKSEAMLGKRSVVAVSLPMATKPRLLSQDRTRRWIEGQTHQKTTDSPSAILSGFVAVLFSEIVSAKCKNALPGLVLVIDSAAELDVDVAINGQFCPASPQISARLIEGLKRRVVQHTYQIMFHDHFVRLIIFVGIHVAKAMTGGPTASYGKHGKLQNPFPPRRQTKPVITTHNNGIAPFVAEKNSVQKTLTSRYDLRLG